MRLYLQAYQINGQTLGTELETWNGDQLGNNEPFITSTFSFVDGYSNITSIENWHRFGENVISSYQDRQRAIKLAFYDKGWSNCTSAEKNLVMFYHANPDLGNNNQNTQMIMYMLGKGLTMDQATDTIIDNWHNHWEKFIQECPDRFRKATKVVLRYLSFTEASDLDLTIESLKNRYMTTGVLGLGYGDHKEGLLNYIWSNNSYVGQGLEEAGYTLKKGTWVQFKQEIEDNLISVYFWPDIKTHLQNMS
jgi:hypothetical protein